MKTMKLQQGIKNDFAKFQQKYKPFEGVNATSKRSDPSFTFWKSSPVPEPTTAMRTFGHPASLLKNLAEVRTSPRTRCVKLVFY